MAGARALARSEEQQAELAHLKLVPARQGGSIYPFAVEVRAVERADIVGPVGALVVTHLGVAARNGDVVKENIALGVTADRDHDSVLRSEDEPRPGIGPASHHQDHGGGRSARAEKAQTTHPQGTTQLLVLPKFDAPARQARPLSLGAPGEPRKRSKN
jgi:hypothetical protein